MSQCPLCWWVNRAEQTNKQSRQGWLFGLQQRSVVWEWRVKPWAIFSLFFHSRHWWGCPGSLSGVVRSAQSLVSLRLNPSKHHSAHRGAPCSAVEEAQPGGNSASGWINLVSDIPLQTRQMPAHQSCRMFEQSFILLDTCCLHGATSQQELGLGTLLCNLLCMARQTWGNHTRVKLTCRSL